MEAAKLDQESGLKEVERTWKSNAGLRLVRLACYRVGTYDVRL
jgi:hypothetical protein